MGPSFRGFTKHIDPVSLSFGVKSEDVRVTVKWAEKPHLQLETLEDQNHGEGNVHFD
jgi:hypothetical protein